MSWLATRWPTISSLIVPQRASVRCPTRVVVGDVDPVATMDTAAAWLGTRSTRIARTTFRAAVTSSLLGRVRSAERRRASSGGRARPRRPGGGRAGWHPRRHAGAALGGTRGAAGQCYIVQVSDDTGATWQTVAVGLAEPAVTLTSDDLKGDEVTVRILATTGSGTSVVRTDTVPVR